MNLLVYDDDAAVGAIVVKVATLAGMNAYVVVDKDTFSQRVRSDSPHVIVLDLQLGNTDGIEQLRVLADLDYTGKLVLMSGFDPRVLSSDKKLAESHGLNVVGVVEKPFHLADLEQMFARLQSVSQLPSPEEIQQAIRNDEMILEFQPVVARNPKKLIKLEALIRWEHPVIGRISPGIFVPVAESNLETIHVMTDWVVAAAIEAYQVLVKLGIDVRMAVNMSARNLHDRTWPDRIQQLLEAKRMPAQRLSIEITESSVFESRTRIMDILSRLRLKGIELAMDDFGTGYSSLQQLCEMPFSEIKVDQSFVTDLTSSRDSRTVVKSIIDLAMTMGMESVAEGVETEEAANLLEQMGVGALQGYFIAKPMPIEAVPGWLETWSRSSEEIRQDQTPKPSVGPPTSHDDRSTAYVQPSTTSSGRTGKGVLLPPRQLEVLQLLAEGCSVKQVAHRLNLGIGTVKVHLALAYSTLGVHNRIDAIRRAGPAVLNRLTAIDPEPNEVSVPIQG